MEKPKHAVRFDNERCCPPYLVLINEPSDYYSASCVNNTLVFKVYGHRSEFRDDKAISIHETASEIIISYALIIPYRVTSFLNMQGNKRTLPRTGQTLLSL
jgi:hypothetical protein